jgi:hypothetical protein
MNDSQTTTRPEMRLLIHRLLDMAATHENREEKDGYAYTSDTLTAALARDGVLCCDLLREAAAMLEALSQ